MPFLEFIIVDIMKIWIQCELHDPDRNKHREVRETEDQGHRSVVGCRGLLLFAVQGAESAIDSNGLSRDPRLFLL